MRLPTRDVVTTGLVLAAGVLYLLWVIDVAPPGMSGTRATGLIVLGPGFAASASAVVPGFDRLIHDNKAYLAVTSLIGLVALAGGVQMLLSASELGLGVLVGTMGVLCLIATIHHAVPAERAASARPRVRPPRHGPRPAGISGP